MKILEDDILANWCIFSMNTVIPNFNLNIIYEQTEHKTGEAEDPMNIQHQRPASGACCLAFT